MNTSFNGRPQGTTRFSPAPSTVGLAWPDLSERVAPISQIGSYRPVRPRLLLARTLESNLAITVVFTRRSRRQTTTPT